MATSKAKPALASHAEKARSRRGEVEYAIMFNSRVQIESPMNKDNIIPSRHKRAERI